MLRAPGLALLIASALCVFLFKAHDALAKSPFDGEWLFTYSCDGATDLYAARCADGERDYFSHSVKIFKNDRMEVLKQ